MLREYTAEDPSAPNQLETSGPADSGDDLSDGSIANVLAHYGAAAGGAESDDDSNNDGNEDNEAEVMVQRQPQTTIKLQLGTARR